MKHAVTRVDMQISCTCKIINLFARPVRLFSLAGASSVSFLYAAIGFCSLFAIKLPSACALIIICRPARYNLCCLLCCRRDVGTICSHVRPDCRAPLSLNPCSASYNSFRIRRINLFIVRARRGISGLFCEKSVY